MFGEYICQTVDANNNQTYLTFTYTKLLKLNLVVDIGNSRVKICVFDGDSIVFDTVSGTFDMLGLRLIKEKWNIENIIVSSVKGDRDGLKEMLNVNSKCSIVVDYLTPEPIENLYETPSTLGIDRLAAAIGANYLQPCTDLLIVDAGTAITIDYVNSRNQYIGGNISPGLTTRFKALNYFTKQLPVVEVQNEFPLVGKTTSSAILAGVELGLVYEIDGYIQDHIKRNSYAKTFITGGDAFFFEKNLKNTIFVEPFLVHKGLNRILNYNAFEI